MTENFSGKKILINVFVGQQFDKIYEGNIKYQIEAFKHYEDNLNRRESINLKPPCDSSLIQLLYQ